MMATTAKVKNASPNTGSRCRSGHNRGWLWPTSAWALLCVFCVGINIDAEAATFIVDSTADAVDATPGNGVCATSGAVCTLRAAIQESNALAGADTVTVPTGTYTLTIAGTGENAAATGDLDITDEIVINGNAASATIIDANTIDRVFDILGSAVTASDLTVRNGNLPDNGGGIKVDSSGSLTLSNSTVDGNTASGSTDGGGIHAAGNSDFTNVTLSGNSAGRGGGMSCTAICTLTNATVTVNTASSAGGGIHQGGGGGTSITFLNTIVANNSSPGNVGCDGPAARLISSGYNLSSDATCDFTSAGDLENTDPLLGPLQGNGGPTFTHELLTGSPAIDAGTNTGCPATDQRGFARPVGVTCDIGSYEAAAVPFSARWPLDETSGVTAFDVDSGNNGTYQNGVLLNQIAACTNTGTGVHFNGVDQLVEVPHSPDYLMNEGTVAMWVNIDAIGVDQAFFSKDSTDLDTGGHLTLSVQPLGDVQVRLQSTSSSMFVNSIAPITAGTWFHAAFTWGQGGMALYVDGAAPVTDPYTGGLGVTSGGTGNFEPIAFGAGTVVSDDLLVTPTTNFFAGYMDDVRIYNRALTQPEIQTLSGCAPSLDIVKRAFWPDGTPIPTGATIPSGVEFKYLLYVNNPSVARIDVSVRDVLDPTFLYQPGTIQVDNSLAECVAAICTVAEEQAIFAAVDGAAFLTDAADGDVASYTGASSSVDAGNGNVANPQLNINADAVWAILFSTKMP